MNKNFPTSMIVVAAVVSFGMIGSQLDLGGLSGQAAGGESAGCGGDAYYDEDLGALVDSEGNVIDESGDAGASTQRRSRRSCDQSPIPAGSAVQQYEWFDARSSRPGDASVAADSQIPANRDEQTSTSRPLAVVVWGADEAVTKTSRISRNWKTAMVSGG